MSSGALLDPHGVAQGLGSSFSGRGDNSRAQLPSVRVRGDSGPRMERSVTAASSGALVLLRSYVGSMMVFVLPRFGGSVLCSSVLQKAWLGRSEWDVSSMATHQPL